MQIRPRNYSTAFTPVGGSRVPCRFAHVQCVTFRRIAVIVRPITTRPRQYTAHCRPFATGVRICWTTAGSERAHRAIARPHQTKVAHNFPRSFFENCSKRCNSNAMISSFGVVTGDLRATFPRNHAHDRSHTPRKTKPDVLLQSGSIKPVREDDTTSTLAQ